MLDGAPASSAPDARTSGGAAAGFVATLRERTAAVHREAERSGFVADLIRARATRAGYALYLRNLVPVYDALEAALGAALAVRAPTGALASALAAFADPGLHRRAALRADLAATAGPGWADLAVLAEAKDYAEDVTSADAAGLVAHAYARYGGDLSGGQILKPLLARTLGLGPDALGVYDFPDVLTLPERKAALHAALDGIVPGGADAEHVIETAVAAFRRNIALSCAVARATAGGA